jgi:hypothetical protein
MPASASRDGDSSLSEPHQADEMEKEKMVITDAPVVPAQYPSPQKRIVIMTALYLAVFLVTLVTRIPPFPHLVRTKILILMQDQNIISTAIPRITDEFHSLNDVGWYGSAYILTMCRFVSPILGSRCPC